MAVCTGEADCQSLHNMSEERDNVSLTADYADQLSNDTYIDCDSGSGGQTIDDVPYSVVVNGFLSPILVGITLITNVCVCAVLVRPNMRSATNVLLVAMAVSDTLTGICPLPAYFRFFTFGSDEERRDWLPHGWCLIYYCLTDHLPTIFHTASIWLTVSLAIQRYICVCRSVNARRMCTAQNSLRVVAVVYATACLYQVSRFFELTYIPVELPSRNSAHEGAIRCTTGVAENSTHTSSTATFDTVVGCRYEYRSFLRPHLTAYFNVYYWFRVIAVHLVPCSALVALTSALVAAMRRAQARRRLLLAQNRKSESRRLAESNVTTMMLVAVVGVFLVVEFPLAVIFIIVIIENTLDIAIVNPDSMATASLFVNLFILLSYPVNFFIYCGMSQQFRSTLRSLLLCRSPPPDVGASTHGVSVTVGMATGGSTPGGGGGGGGGGVTQYVSLTAEDNGRVINIIKQSNTTQL